MSKCSSSSAETDTNDPISKSRMKSSPDITGSMSTWASIISYFSENAAASNKFLGKDPRFGLCRRNLGLCFLGSEMADPSYAICFKTISCFKIL